MNLAFLDLEATGLDRTKGSILELGMVITDESLEVQGFYEQNVKPLPGFQDDFTQLDPVVIAMHTKNGLFAEIADGDCMRRYEAELDALAWLSSWGDLMLVGNSVYFDRFWLDDHMPKLAACFKRHLIDITSLNRAAALFNKKLYEDRPREANGSRHRALTDSIHSLTTLRYYRDAGAFAPHQIPHNAYRVVENSLGFGKGE